MANCCRFYLGCPEIKRSRCRWEVGRSGSDLNGTRIFATSYISIGCVVDIRFHSLLSRRAALGIPGNRGGRSREELRTNAVAIDESSCSVKPQAHGVRRTGSDQVSRRTRGGRTCSINRRISEAEFPLFYALDNIPHPSSIVK